MDTARRQGSLGFEVRAATSLARIMLDDGRKAEACALLAPMVRAFGRDASSPDLQKLGAVFEEVV
jgi:hypothetical protein